MPCYHSLKKPNTAERLRTANNLLRLRVRLDRDIPKKTATDTLLLATWNIREFGDSRRKESLFYIAEIIARFDMVAVQEISADLKGLEELVRLLDPGWDYFVTDSTDGSAGGGERTAFLYDGSKIRFRKMAGEITLPPEKPIDGKLQFARTPCTTAKFYLSVGKPLTGIGKLLADLSKSLTDPSKLFTDLSKSLTDLSELFADPSKSLTDLSKLFTDPSRSFTDINK